MNTVSLIGNLTRDSELKYTQGKGTAVTKITLAVKRDKDNTDFIPVTVWGKAAEVVANYCLKGSKIGVEGSIKTGSYDKDGTKVYTFEVSTMKIELLGGKKDNQGQQEQSHGSYNGDMDMIPYRDWETDRKSVV